MTASDTTSDGEWQRVVQRMKTNESKLEQAKKMLLGFKMKQKSNLVPEEFYSIFYAIYAMYNYFIFSNIDYLLIKKLSFVFTRCHSLSRDVPLVCLFIRIIYEMTDE